jgi:histidyl-tRNA synthetase
VQRGLDLLEIPYRIEPRMVRGLDYYTRTAFEIIHSELGKTKAVGGGGRYDSLVQELGGPDISGIGFAIGLERLSMGLADDDPQFVFSIDVYIAAIGEKVRETAFQLANVLRQAGISTDMRNSEMSLKAQMKVADRIGARKVILLGEDEVSRNEVVVRKMSTGEQTAVPIEEIVTYLQGDKS